MCAVGCSALRFRTTDSALWRKPHTTMKQTHGLPGRPIAWRSLGRRVGPELVGNTRDASYLARHTRQTSPHPLVSSSTSWLLASWTSHSSDMLVHRGWENCTEQVLREARRNAASRSCSGSAEVPGAPECAHTSAWLGRFRGGFQPSRGRA